MRCRASIAESHQEQRYRARFLEADTRQTTVVLALIAVAVLAIGRDDFLLLRGAALRVTLAVKAVTTLVALISILLLQRARWPRQHDRIVATSMFALAATLLQAAPARFSAGEHQGFFVGQIVLIGVLYFGVRGPLWHRAFTALVSSIAAAVLLWSPAASVSPVARLTGPIALVALNVVGIVSSRAFEEQRRKRFLAERHERRAQRKLAAQMRELAAAKLRAESMSRARMALLAALSHELRAPMSAVIGRSDLLVDAPLDARHREHVAAIGDGARSMLRLLDDLLDFATIDAGQLVLTPAPFEVRPLCDSVVEMFRPRAKLRSIDLALEVSPGVPACLLGDEARLRQVLVNLASNAVKFTERGHVRLRVEAAAGGEICFRVEDTGIGMLPDTVARMFLPFEQADQGSARGHGGTGLGLAISKQIVTAFGGEIRVASDPGRGSRFTVSIRLPAATMPRSSAPPSVPTTRQRPPFSSVVKPIDLEEIDAPLGRAVEERGAAYEESDSEALLSREPLEKLRELEQLVEPGFFASLCEDFIVDTRARLGEMKSAVARGAEKELEPAAHGVRSAAASLGASELSRLCAGLEAAAREGRFEGTAPQIQAISLEFERVERALRREIEGSSDSESPFGPSRMDELDI